jgi:hypothetical protein
MAASNPCFFCFGPWRPEGASPRGATPLPQATRSVIPRRAARSIAPTQLHLPPCVVALCPCSTLRRPRLALCAISRWTPHSAGRHLGMPHFAGTRSPATSCADECVGRSGRACAVTLGDARGADRPGYAEAARQTSWARRNFLRVRFRARGIVSHPEISNFRMWIERIIK